MIFSSKPEDFNSRFSVVGCFVESDGKILLLHRQSHKPQGNTWGVPAGKIEEDESPNEAMLRELCEETGIILRDEDLKHERLLCVRYDEYDFVYHIFQAKVKISAVTINTSEHKEHVWVKPEKALAMSLIQDLDECILLQYSVFR